MKAYRVHDGDPMEGCVLVFANSISRAKTLALTAGWMDEWTSLRVQRQSDWDEYATKEQIIEENSELPVEAPRFYSPHHGGFDYWV